MGDSFGHPSETCRTHQMLDDKALPQSVVYTASSGAIPVFQV
jgi:hypothetical protein